MIKHKGDGRVPESEKRLFNSIKAIIALEGVMKRIKRAQDHSQGKEVEDPGIAGKETVLYAAA